jgi:hypothetical protein
MPIRNTRNACEQCFNVIRDHLIPAVEDVFPHLPLKISPDSNPIISLSSDSDEIGELHIYDDEDEATVVITGIAHGHFNVYDEKLSREEGEQIVTEDVISFLVALFSDRVVLYRTLSKDLGGWTVVEHGIEDIEFVSGREYFVWSGPIKPPED